MCPSWPQGAVLLLFRNLGLSLRDGHRMTVLVTLILQSNSKYPLLLK